MRQIARIPAPVLRLADGGEVNLGGFCISPFMVDAHKRHRQTDSISGGEIQPLAQWMRGSVLR